MDLENYKKPLNKRLIVVLTGAGISAESGIETFRGTDGLWNTNDIMKVASIEAWETNPKAVLDFCNDRRQKIKLAKPNAGHKALADLESDFEVIIITQNIDDLHERAGSTKVLHLHGEITKSRGLDDYIYMCDGDLHIGSKCPRGGQLRPHVVLFGEAVPDFGAAYNVTIQADYFICVGTSLKVYPASNLIKIIDDVPKYLVDINPVDTSIKNLTVLAEPASTALIKIGTKITLEDMYFKAELQTYLKNEDLYNALVYLSSFDQYAKTANMLLKQYNTAGGKLMEEEIKSFIYEILN